MWEKTRNAFFDTLTNRNAFLGTQPQQGTVWKQQCSGVEIAVQTTGEGLTCNGINRQHGEDPAGRCFAATWAFYFILPRNL